MVSVLGRARPKRGRARCAGVDSASERRQDEAPGRRAPQRRQYRGDGALSRHAAAAWRPRRGPGAPAHDHVADTGARVLNPLKQTKLGVGAAAPGGVFSGAADFDWHWPSSAATKVQAAPMAPPRSAFKKAPHDAPLPSEPMDDEDERMMAPLVGLVEPWLAPEAPQASPFQKTPSTRPPPSRASGRRSEPESPQPELCTCQARAIEQVDAARSGAQQATGTARTGERLVPQATGSSASRAAAAATLHARARASRTAAATTLHAARPPAPSPYAAPPTARPPSQAAPAGRARQNTPQPQVHSRAPAPPPPQPPGAISRPLPPLQSASAAPRPGTPPPRSADGVRLALNDRDVVAGAVRTGNSQRAPGVPAPRNRTSPLVLGLGATAVAVGVLAWIALSGGEPAPAPVAAPIPAPAAVAPAAEAPVEAVPPQAP